MNQQFYTLMDNTSYKRGMPVIERILEGIIYEGPCPLCGVDRRNPSGDLYVNVYTKKAKQWPDLLACGGYPCFVLSDRMIDAMDQQRINFLIAGKIHFAETSNKGLSPASAPQYYWLDGVNSRAASMNFEASGYVDTRFCPECGVRSADISKTYDKQHYSDPPLGFVFEYDESTGLDIFTSDISPTRFFCTHKVYECAKKHKLINLAFSRVEDGNCAKPLKY